jgi:hypothetical protein
MDGVLLEGIQSGDFLRDRTLGVYEIQILIDPQNGIWDMTGRGVRSPCQCVAEFVETPRIMHWHCPYHPAAGVLIHVRQNAKFFLLTGGAMDESLKKVLETWDTLRYSGLSLVEVRKFIDPEGGVWDLSDPRAVVGPCGCITLGQHLPSRQYWRCEKHPERGILIDNYRNGKLYWLTGKNK